MGLKHEENWGGLSMTRATKGDERNDLRVDDSWEGGDLDVLDGCVGLWRHVSWG